MYCTVHLLLFCTTASKCTWRNTSHSSTPTQTQYVPGQHDSRISIQIVYIQPPHRLTSWEFISVINQIDAQNLCFAISLFHASTYFEHMWPSSGDQNCTYRCDDTRGYVMQFWPPDDGHMCSKHVEAWNKLIVKQKFCASSWSITDIKYTEMHGQQNGKKNSWEL